MKMMEAVLTFLFCMLQIDAMFFGHEHVRSCLFLLTLNLAACSTSECLSVLPAVTHAHSACSCHGWNIICLAADISEDLPCEK